MANTILYISYDGMTDPLGRSQVIPYLEGLSKEGFTIHLISCEKEKRFESGKSTIQKILDKSSIFWHPLPYTPKPPILSTISDIRSITQLAYSLNSVHHFNIVHCRSYIAALVGLSMKKKLGTSFLFDMRGFWPDERVDGGLWKLKNPIFNWVYKYFKKKEKEFILKADGIITLTVSAKEYLLKNFGAQLNVKVIPCAADLDFFIPQSKTIREKQREELNLNDEFLLCYLGSIGTWYMLDEMLDFFKVLKELKPDSKFLFITADHPVEILKKATEKRLDANDLIISKSSRESLPNLIAAVDASIFFILPTFSKSASSPTKHGELLGCQVPVVCNVIGDLQLILNFRKTGVIVEEFKKEAYKTAATKLLSEKYEEDHFKDTAEKFYSLKNGISTYLEMYNELSNDKKN